jgi:hypothetical protein
MTDTGKIRIQRAIIAVLVLVIAALAWKFIVAGSTHSAPDGRTLVELAPPERALMLAEMRGFVAGLQQVTDALARDDMAAVTTAALAVGTAKAHDVPVAMLAKLPLDFKRLAFGVHGGFDAIAQDARAGGPPGRILGRLSAVLAQCVECHSRYALASVTPSP